LHPHNSAELPKDFESRLAFLRTPTSEFTAQLSEFTVNAVKAILQASDGPFRSRESGMAARISSRAAVTDNAREYPFSRLSPNPICAVYSALSPSQPITSLSRSLTSDSGGGKFYEAAGYDAHRRYMLRVMAIQ